MKLCLGENIRKYRKEAGLTQEQLAERLGVSYQSVSRWENGSTYPDMELLPAIAAFFSASVDELLGMPKEKKEKLAMEAFTRLAEVSVQKPVDTEKMVRLIQDIRQNYLGSRNFCHFWLSVEHGAYRMPEVLPEVRLTVEAILDGDFDFSQKNEAIYYMAELEDDEHIGDFLARYASKRDLRVDALLGNESLWQNFSQPKEPERYLAVNSLQLTLLNAFCNQKPSDGCPISGVGELDFLVHERLCLGFQRAACLARLGQTEELFVVLKDAVLLLEKAMAIKEPITLSCSAPWLEGFDWIGEEAWNNSEGSMLLADVEERSIYIHKERKAEHALAETSCYVIFPSWFRDALAGKKWNFICESEWFEKVRDDRRFQACLSRVEKLVCTRKKKG